MVESFQFGSNPGSSPERDAVLLTGSHIQQVLLTPRTDICSQPVCHGPCVTAQGLCQATGLQNNGYSGRAERKTKAGKLTQVSLPPFAQAAK